MSSHPYQSRVLNSLIRQGNTIRDRAQRLHRWAKLAVVWGGQTLLYPVWKLMTGLRPMAQAMGQGAQQTLHQLRGIVNPEHYGAEATDSSRPIQAVLSAIALQVNAPEPNSLPLAPRARIELPQTHSTQLSSPKVGTNRKFALAIALGTELIRQVKTFLHQSWTQPVTLPLLAPANLPIAGAISPITVAVLPLAPQRPGWLRRTWQALTCALTHPLHRPLAQHLRLNPSSIEHAQLQIQGIASHLDSRHLVLVGVANQILDILSPEQQTLLTRRIHWELASYYFRCRQVERSLQPIVLPQLSRPKLPTFRFPIPQRLQGALPLARRDQGPPPLSLSTLGLRAKGWLNLPIPLPSLPAFLRPLVAKGDDLRLVRDHRPAGVPSPMPLRRLQLGHWLKLSSLIGVVAAFPLAIQPVRALELGGIVPQAEAAVLPQPCPAPPETLVMPTERWVDPNRVKPAIWRIASGFINLVSQGKPEIAEQFPPLIPLTPVQNATTDKTNAHLSQTPYVIYTSEGPQLEVNAEVVGYDPHLLEQVVAWLDRGLSWMEGAIATSWTLVSQWFVATLSLLQKIRP